MKGTGIPISGFRWILGVVLLFGVGFAPTPRVEAQELRYGLGLYGSMLQPMGPFKGWYNISPAFIAQLTYVVSPRTMTEVEVHYTTLSDAGLDGREFVWHNGLGAANGSKVKSPSAKADMWIASLVVNGLRTFKPDEAGQTVPYIVAGIGFYKFNHEVTGLIWPGQVGNQIKADAQSMLEPTRDTDAALSINTGLGFYHRTSERFLVDFRVRWNVSMGELRPYEDWGLKKTFPIQSLNLMIGLKYFLS
jgi:hypothetical protein